MTTTEREAQTREMFLDQQEQVARITVKDRCPFYRPKAEEEGRVTSCDGDVTFTAGEDSGVCQDCGRHVPIFLEM